MTESKIEKEEEKEKQQEEDNDEEEEEEDDDMDSDPDSPLKLREVLERELEGQGEAIEEHMLESLAPAPPDGGWGWVICGASFLCNLILDGIAYSFGVMLGPICRYFDSDAGTVSWVGSVLCGVYLMSGPIVGGLVNKYGCRPVCIAGSVIACVSLCLSILSPNVPTLMLLYGVCGGFGLGLIYLPAVVMVGYYFEKKRAVATGISVCGSGVGTFIFAPLASFLVETFGWKGANLIFAALCLQCATFGALMRPLELSVVVKEEGDKDDEEKFTLSLPDGTRHKQSVTGSGPSSESNSLHKLDQVVSSPSHRVIPLMLTELPTIAEQQTITAAQTQKEEHALIQDVFPTQLPSRKRSRIRTSSENQPQPNTKFTISVVKTPSSEEVVKSAAGGGSGKMLRNQSAPHFAVMSRNYSTVFTPIPRVGSQAMCSVGSASTLQQAEGGGQTRRPARISIRPLARKDIFYSGSIQALQAGEEESQDVLETRKSQGSVGRSGMRSNKQSYISMSSGLRSNKQSFISIYRGSLVNSALALPIVAEQKRASFSLRSQDVILESGSGGVLTALKEMMDVSLLKDPLFTLIGISNVFGMFGFYTPFVYLPQMAAQYDGISVDDAAFLISIIGISNTLGRVLFGWLSDLPWVNSLVVTNLALIASALCVMVFPFCSSYPAFVATALLFGFFVAAYICLTSIVLVDLCGIDKLTTAFGLLTLFRGTSSMVGPPVSGLIFESTQSFMWSFFASAACLLIAGLISSLVDLLRRIKQRKEAAEAIDSKSAGKQML